jgi:hypothetical protein
MGFGELLDSGRMVGINQVARGLGCECVCPACRRPLIARQGSKRTWHFSHAPGELACRQGAETGLHRMAKQIIAQWNVVELPALAVHAECETDSGERLRAQEMLPRERFEVQAAELEAGLGSLRPDVLLEDLRGRRLAVEVRVTHAVDEAKQSRVACLDLAMIEYDLSLLSRDGLDEPRLVTELAAMTPQWVHHPLAGDVRRRLEEALRRAAEDRDQVSAAKVGRQDTNSLPVVAHGASAQPTTADAEDVESDPREAPGHEGSVEMVFDPALGLFERGRPPKPPRRFANFTLMGVEVRIRSHDLLEAVAVWACDSRPELQERVLRVLAKDGRAAGVTCSTHALYLGYFLAWGTEAPRWVRDLPSRLATLECIALAPVGRPPPARSTALLDRLRLFGTPSPGSPDTEWPVVAQPALGRRPDSPD